MASSGKEKALDSALAQIKKQFGDGALMRLGEATHLAVDAISTGSLALDLALGVGGVPRGRVTEIYGPESAGKTTLCQHIVAEAQHLGGTCAYVDMEHALDPGYAERCGVDVDNLLIAQPDTGEQALEIAEQLVRSGAIDVVVVDSVAALVPRAEIEGEMGDAPMGMQARLMSQALRKLSGAIKQSNTCMIFTNQLRQKIGVMFGNPETTTGGMALKFYASVRLDMRKIGFVKGEGGEIVGIKCRAKAVKNKVAPPFREAEFELNFSGSKIGVVREGELLDLGVVFGVIEKSGASFSFEGEKLGFGRAATVRILAEEKKDVADRIEAAIRKAAAEGGNEQLLAGEAKPETDE